MRASVSGGGGAAMKLEVAAGATGVQARLLGRFGIADVADAKPALLALVEQSSRLQLDLSGVESFDAAAMQLLMLCKREALARGHVLELSEHSQAVLELFELFNLAGLFGDPLVMLRPSTLGAPP